MSKDIQGLMGLTGHGLKSNCTAQAPNCIGGHSVYGITRYHWMCGERGPATCCGVTVSDRIACVPLRAINIVVSMPEY